MTEDKIGLEPAQEYIQQLCLSIIDDLDNNNFSWYGDERGIFLTINGQQKFISNDANEEKEIRELWKQAKNKPQKSSRSTSASSDSSEH